MLTILALLQLVAAMGIPVCAAPLSLELQAAGGGGRSYNYALEGFSSKYQTSDWLAMTLKATGYEVRTHEAVGSPLNARLPPARGHNFGRVAAGLQLGAPGGFQAEAYAGQDTYESRAKSAGGALSFWPIYHGYHPIQLRASAEINDASHVWADSAVATLGLGRMAGLIVFGLVEGALYQGRGFKPVGLAGAGLMAEHGRSGLGAKVSAGGGFDGPYGELSIFESFGL